MSFTTILIFAYIIMLAGIFAAFKRKYKAIGVILLLVMMLGTIALEYLWINCPM